MPDGKPPLQWGHAVSGVDTTIIWIEGRILPFDPPLLQHRSHFRCENGGVESVQKGRFRVLRYGEGKARLLYDGVGIAFKGEVIPLEHMPCTKERESLGIWADPVRPDDKNCSEFILRTDPLAGKVGCTPVFWNPRDRVLYGGGYVLDENNRLYTWILSEIYHYINEIG